MSRLPRLAASSLLALSLALPALAANPFDAFDPPKATLLPPADPLIEPGADDWYVPEANPFAQWAPPQSKAAPSSWNWAIGDLMSLCTQPTMEYCLCMANRVQDRMEPRDYERLAAALAASRTGATIARDLVPFGVALLQESNECQRQLRETQRSQGVDPLRP